MTTLDPGISDPGAGVLETVPSPVPSGAPNSRRIPLGDLAWLLAICGIFVAGLTYLGTLRFENFYTANWDLGINQQLLWTAAHGQLMYETGDAEFYGIHSFLQVHPAYVGFLIAPIYAWAPFPWTLFILQSSIFVATVIPLYLLARTVIEDRRWIFLGLILFVMSFPVISGLLYDFHWEAFLPFEFAMFFYLFRSQRYGWSLVPLSVGILTLEVFPFLVGGVAVLVLYERWQHIGSRWRILIRDRLSRVAFVLLLIMLVVYVAQRVIQVQVIPAIAGYSGSPSAFGGEITGILNVHLTPGSLILSTNYWLLMLAAFAFLPLLAPRYLLLELPWFIYSVVLSPFFSSQYGDQYALVAVSTLSVALVYGLARAVRIANESNRWKLPQLVLVGSSIWSLAVASLWSPLLLSRTVPWPVYILLVAPPVLIVYWLWSESHRDKAPTPHEHSSGPSRSRSAFRRRGVVMGASIACFVAFNVLMSPLNAANFQATSYTGYWLRYSPNPLSADMPWITSSIPSNAVVLTSDFLFAYVANDPNAWAVTWYPVVPGQPPLYFPFDANHLPRYVLIDEADWFNFPSSITSQLSNRSVYGLVAYVFSTETPGTIALYRLGYGGPASARVLGSPPTTRYYTAANLTVGPSGRVRPDASALFGTIIESQPVTEPSQANRSIWYGPYVSLPPGAYRITANLSGTLLPGGDFSQPILTMTGGPYFVRPIYNISVHASQLASKGWSTISWSIDLTAAWPLMEFRGYLEYSDGRPTGSIELNYLEVASTDP